MGTEPADERGVYGISVAAELTGLGMQNLRAYEARGLLEPARTEGGTRRYSANDLDRLRRIADLLDAGLNLAGVGMVMDLQDENRQLRAENAQQRSHVTMARSRSAKRGPGRGRPPTEG